MERYSKLASYRQAHLLVAIDLKAISPPVLMSLHARMTCLILEKPYSKGIRGLVQVVEIPVLREEVSVRRLPRRGDGRPRHEVGPPTCLRLLLHRTGHQQILDLACTALLKSMGGLRRTCICICEKHHWSYARSRESVRSAT